MMKVHAGNSKINGSALIYFFKLFCALFCIWILLSGKFEVKFLAVGLLTSLGTAYLFLPLFTMQNKKTGEPIYLLQTSLCRLLGYSLWLLGEVVKASLSATGLVLRGKTDARKFYYPNAGNDYAFDQRGWYFWGACDHRSLCGGCSERQDAATSRKALRRDLRI